jgi:hypothetical protein
VAARLRRQICHVVLAQLPGEAEDVLGRRAPPVHQNHCQARVLRLRPHREHGLTGVGIHLAIIVSTPKT